MENTLLMRTEASYSLNFLVYIQNMYLNQGKGSEELKFPCLPTNCEFRSDFETCFRELWNEVSKRLSVGPIHDQKIFYEEKNVFYKRLFIDSEEAFQQFNEIYQSFKIWRGSLAGRFAVERSIDAYIEKVYTELAQLLLDKEVKPKRSVDISILYDDCVVVDLEPASYFVVLSIRDCILNYKELLAKVEVSIR